jgi:hypothetical protein
MDRRQAGLRRRGAAPAILVVLVAALQFGCDRKPGDGPSAVTPPSNVRTPDMTGAEPGAGPATPATPGPQGAAATVPAPQDSVLVDEGLKGQALPEPQGGATHARLLDKDREQREAEAETDFRTAEEPVQPGLPTAEPAQPAVAEPTQQVVGQTEPAPADPVAPPASADAPRDAAPASEQPLRPGQITPPAGSGVGTQSGQARQPGVQPPAPVAQQTAQQPTRAGQILLPGQMQQSAQPAPQPGQPAATPSQN